jgi:hypothetical protein
MKSTKQIYIHFDRAGYLETKSDFLKIQTEIVELKKRVQEVFLTRKKKDHYRKLLEETTALLLGRVEKLDEFMPIGEEVSLPRQVKAKISQKRSKEGEGQDAEQPEADDVEAELIQIRKKLELLNQA